MVAPLEAMRDRFGDLDVARSGAVATVVIDRPDKLNALRRRVWRDLCDALSMLHTDGRTRVVILTGAGDRAFSAGGDIAEFVEIDGIDDARAYQDEAMSAFLAVERSPLTTIAAVNGLALGGGCELSLACDIVLASDDASFGMPESRLGLVPGYGVVRAPEVIGPRMAKYLIATGQTLSAARACEVGLAIERYPIGELMPAARALAERIADRSTGAIAIGKRLVDRWLERGSVERSIEALAQLQASPDRAEGVAAFLERRQPVFASPAQISDTP